MSGGELRGRGGLDISASVDMLASLYMTRYCLNYYFSSCDQLERRRVINSVPKLWFRGQSLTTEALTIGYMIIFTSDAFRSFKAFFFLKH